MARTWLADRGYASTLEYVADMARLVLEETGLLPHMNPGVMSWVEMQRLKPLAPSMGMMLETTSTRLWAERGGAHFGSPDKDPAVRLAVLESAGRSRIPFTTGVLLGIGENTAERIEAVLALREVQERHGHLQEVIVQNFRAKGGTAMLASPDLQTEEYAAAVAVTRVLLGPGMRIQAPPNLTDTGELALLLRAGIDDWGGVSPLTPDHVNPERPWPQIDELARLTAAEGFELRERLTTHPHYVRESRAGTDSWVDDRLLPTVLAMADDHGLARDDARLGPFPASAPVAPAPSSLGRLLARAAADPAGLDDAAYGQLLQARGEDLEALAALADDVRREAVGDTVTYAVNRNLDSSLGLPAARVTELAAEAVTLGATEICAQGAMSGPADYLEFARAVRAADPGLHLHAFRPAEHLAAATEAGISLAEWFARVRDAGVGSVPGTGARILDDEVRALLDGRRRHLLGGLGAGGHRRPPGRPADDGDDGLRPRRVRLRPGPPPPPAGGDPGRDRRLHRAHPDALGADRVTGPGRGRASRSDDGRVARGARRRPPDAPRARPARAGGLDQARAARCPAGARRRRRRPRRGAAGRRPGPGGRAGGGSSARRRRRARTGRIPRPSRAAAHHDVR